MLARTPPVAGKANHPGHFRLDGRVVEEVNSKPPLYATLRHLHFVAPRPPDKEPSHHCSCKGACGDDCLNRAISVECTGGPDASADLAAEAKRKSRPKANPFDNCTVGCGCGNRQIQARAYPATLVCREAGRGWGVKASEDIPGGTLIIEYVGEVIDGEELERRMLATPDDNVYAMELDDGLFVDAREKGNTGRFINHSCGPNCDVQKWIVNGKVRLGIFASQDIPKDTALSYDYRFDTNEHIRFACKCGAANCRGTLSVNGGNARKKQDRKGTFAALEKSPSKMTKKERGQVLRQRLDAAKRLNRDAAAAAKARSLTAKTVPGDATRPVAAGPAARDMAAARSWAVFLPRNARAGAKDWAARKAGWHARAPAPAPMGGGGAV
jgi:hypothetical protein